MLMNAAQYVIDQSLAAILNISFGECESAQALEQLNRSIPSTSKRSPRASRSRSPPTIPGVAGCTAETDLGVTNDVNSNGFAVNGLASTPYDLAVGGTDFNDLSLSIRPQYWNTMNQSGTLASSTSHIPEMVWNDSCANPVYARVLRLPEPIVFCNTATLGSGQNSQSNAFIDISGGGERRQQLHPRPTTAAIATAATHNPTGSRACSASRASAARAVPGRFHDCDALAGVLLRHDALRPDTGTDVSGGDRHCRRARGHLGGGAIRGRHHRAHRSDTDLRHP